MSQTYSDNQFLDQRLIIEKVGIEKGMKVAELGCGSTGFFIFPLAQIVGKEGAVYAVDILKSALESVKSKATINNLKQIKTVWSNLEIFNATAIETESLDVIFLVNTLHQSQKRVDVIREARRMLKRNGKLLIVEWNDSDLPAGPPPENKVKIDLLKNGMQKLGMRLEEEFSAGNYHYGLIFIKS